MHVILFIIFLLLFLISFNDNKGVALLLVVVVKNYFNVSFYYILYRKSKSSSTTTRKTLLKDNEELLDSVCFDNQIGILTLIGLTNSSGQVNKTPRRKRRSSFDGATTTKSSNENNNKWKFAFKIFSCEWSEVSTEPIKTTYFDTDVVVDNNMKPKWCMTQQSTSCSLSLIIELSTSLGKWYKLNNEGEVLFDRDIDLSTTSLFPTTIIGRNDCLVVFYCTDVSSNMKSVTRIQQDVVNDVVDSHIEVWNARYGLINKRKDDVPFPVSRDELYHVGNDKNNISIFTMYKKGNNMLNHHQQHQEDQQVVIVLAKKKTLSDKQCTYETLYYCLNSGEYSDLQLLNQSGNSLSAALGKLVPSTSTTTSSKKIKTIDVNYTAQYDDELTEVDAIDMLYNALTSDVDTTINVKNVRSVAVSLVKRTHGFSSQLLADCIRHQLSSTSSAVIMQVFAQLLYGVCTNVTSRCGSLVDVVVDQQHLEYDNHIQQVMCWIEAILDAHFSSFVMGCQQQDVVVDTNVVVDDENDKKQSSKKKKKGKSKKQQNVDVVEMRQNVNVFRTALMTLLNALRSLEESQDLTEEALGLSCHLHRMLRGPSKMLSKSSSSLESNKMISGHTADGWSSNSKGDASSSSGGLYQVEVIHY